MFDKKRGKKMKTYQLVGFDTGLYPYLIPVYQGENELVKSINNENDIITGFQNNDDTTSFVPLDHVTMTGPNPLLEVSIGDPAIYAYRMTSGQVIATNRIDHYIAILHDDSKNLDPESCEIVQYYMDHFGPYHWSSFDQESSCWGCPFLGTYPFDDDFDYLNDIDCRCKWKDAMIEYSHDAGNQLIKTPYWCPKDHK
jgi:hypothetical protein